MNLLTMDKIKMPNARIKNFEKEDFCRLLKSFGYNYEEYTEEIEAMARTGNELVGAMGIDTPLAVLSKEYQPLFSYFKQLFAQVTNPPIDSIREKIVTSMSVYLGTNGNLLSEQPENCHVLKLDSPILSDLDLLRIESIQAPGFQVARFQLHIIRALQWSVF